MGNLWRKQRLGGKYYCTSMDGANHDKYVRRDRDGLFSLFGPVFVLLFFNIVYVVRALLKGVRSCQLSSTSHPLHKPWLKSLSPPAIFSYPSNSNTTSACRWRVCSPAVHLSAWYVIVQFLPSRHLHCRCPDHQQQKIRVVYSFLNLSSPLSHFILSETCIKGHRSSSCKHTDRPLFEIKKKGRPVTQCEHCRELRKTKQVHVKCICESRTEPSSSSKQGVLTSALFVSLSIGSWIRLYFFRLCLSSQFLSQDLRAPRFPTAYQKPWKRRSHFRASQKERLRTLTMVVCSSSLGDIFFVYQPC